MKQWARLLHQWSSRKEGCWMMKKKKKRCRGPLEVATSLGGRDLVWLDVRSRPGQGRRDLAELQQVAVEVARSF